MTLKFKLAALLSLFFFSLQLTAQNNTDYWQVGIGGSIVQFGSEDSNFIGDKLLLQMPRLNITMPLNKTFSLDGAVSFNSVGDALLISNTVKYMSADGSLRYNFSTMFDSKHAPYIFLGGSIVKTTRKATATLNVGAGNTYWFSERVGLNAQIYYKYSPEQYESMRSHLQGSAGLVFKLGTKRLFRRNFCF